jgi:hypothetical protein
MKIRQGGYDVPYGRGREFNARIRSKQPAHASVTPANDSPMVSHSPPRLSKTLSHSKHQA